MPPRQGFVAKILAQKNHVYLISSVFEENEPETRDAWYFIKVFPSKETAFLALVNHGAGLDIERYGEVLFSGYGAPPEELKASMARIYNMTYDT